MNLPDKVIDAIVGEVEDLRARIKNAIAALEAAPDVIADEASKRQARDVATANRIAWQILSAGRYPESVRHKPATGVEDVGA